LDYPNPTAKQTTGRCSSLPNLKQTPKGTTLFLILTCEVAVGETFRTGQDTINCTQLGVFSVLTATATASHANRIETLDQKKKQMDNASRDAHGDE